MRCRRLTGAALGPHPRLGGPSRAAVNSLANQLPVPVLQAAQDVKGPTTRRPRPGNDVESPRREPRSPPHEHRAIGGLREPGRGRDQELRAGQLKVVRRLRAMLEDLLEVSPEMRAGPIRSELTLVRGAVRRTSSDAEDKARAAKPDEQRIGS